MARMVKLACSHMLQKHNMFATYVVPFVCLPSVFGYFHFWPDLQLNLLMSVSS
jgi:hypothetical protein